MLQVQFNSLVAPFDAAIVFLTIAMGVIWTFWGENKGESATLSAVQPYTLPLTPYTLHPYTLHPTPLHLAPYTLRPAPYTLHPTPYTLHTTPYPAPSMDVLKGW